MTPLMLRIKNADVGVVNVPLSKGADTNIANQEGLTSLMVAVRKKVWRRLVWLTRRQNDNTVTFPTTLLKHGAEVKYIRKSDGKTALSMAVEHDNNPEVIEEPLQWEANVNHVDNNHYTALKAGCA